MNDRTASNDDQSPKQQWARETEIPMFILDFIFYKISLTGSFYYDLPATEIFLPDCCFPTALNTVISPNFMVWKFCRKTQFPHSFRRIIQNYAETAPFHKISTPWSYVELRYFKQCPLPLLSISPSGRNKKCKTMQNSQFLHEN